MGVWIQNPRFALPGRGFRPRRPGGFTLLDLLVAVGVIAILSALVLTGLARARTAAQSMRCMANLHGIGVAFSMYSGENDYRYPTPLSSGRSWESLLEPYARNPLLFNCPADEEIYPAVGSSYDWRDTLDPNTTLVGRRLTEPTRSDTVLAFESLPGWHRAHHMNALFVNGSVLEMSDDACLGDLQLVVWPGAMINGATYKPRKF